MGDLHFVLVVLAPDPDAEQNLHVVFGGQRHGFVEAEIDAVDADAIRDGGEKGKVLVDAFHAGDEVAVEGCFAAPVGRVADAMHLAGRRIDDVNGHAHEFPDEETRKSRDREAQKEGKGRHLHGRFLRLVVCRPSSRRGRDSTERAALSMEGGSGGPYMRTAREHSRAAPRRNCPPFRFPGLPGPDRGPCDRASSARCRDGGQPRSCAPYISLWRGGSSRPRCPQACAHCLPHR